MAVKGNEVKEMAEKLIIHSDVLSDILVKGQFNPDVVVSEYIDGDGNRFEKYENWAMPDWDVVQIESEVQLYQLFDECSHWDIVVSNLINHLTTYEEKLLILYLMMAHNCSLKFIHDNADLIKRALSVFSVIFTKCYSVHISVVDFHYESSDLSNTILIPHPDDDDAEAVRKCSDAYFMYANLTFDVDNGDMKDKFIADYESAYDDMNDILMSVDWNYVPASTLKVLRVSTGLSQAEFAKKYHISLGTYSHWEQGNRKPPEHDVYMLRRLVRHDTAYQSINSIANALDEISAEIGCSCMKMPFMLMDKDGNYMDYSDSTIDEYICDCHIDDYMTYPVEWSFVTNKKDEKAVLFKPIEYLNALKDE